MTTRVGNWRLDECTVYIGRGSKWGNPFVRPGMATHSKYPVTEVEDPIAEYEKYIRSKPELMAELHTLRGEVLGCFCVRLNAPQPNRETCHGHVLVRLVNELSP